MNFSHSIAKDRVSSYLADSFDSGQAAQAGMSANASNEIADTKYGAMMDYYDAVTEAQLSGMDELASAQAGARQNQLIGSIGNTISSLGTKMFTGGLG